MEKLKGKYLRPGRKITDQFILAAAITVLIISVSQTFFPTEWAVGPFEALLGGDHDAAMFLNFYFIFISLWIYFILVVCLFKVNRPMLKAAKYCSPTIKNGADGAVSGNGNRAGNNFTGLLIGIVLGFGGNAF